jgi:hypothetical protein
VRSWVSDRLGDIDSVFPLLPLVPAPKNYVRELGGDLATSIFVLSGTSSIETIVLAKQEAMQFENCTLLNGQRQYNLNIGFVSQRSVWLCSHKARQGRIHIEDSVWIDRQLCWQDTGYVPTLTAFPELADEHRIMRLNHVRQSLSNSDVL